MSAKALLISAVIVAIFVSGAFLFLSREDTDEPAPSADSKGLIIGKNAIYVAEQAPGQKVSVAVVRLEKSGFVVIHEDVGGPPAARLAPMGGAPGKILGASRVLPAGERQDIGPIELSRATGDNETIYAMLHLDDGDGVFDAEKDKPAEDSVSGEPVMTIVTISADAAEPGAVSL